MEQNLQSVSSRYSLNGRCSLLEDLQTMNPALAQRPLEETQQGSAEEKME